jgi:hypothetical protein
MNPVWWRRNGIMHMSGPTSTQRQAVGSKIDPTAVYNSKSEWTPGGHREDHEQATIISSAAVQAPSRATFHSGQHAPSSGGSVHQAQITRHSLLGAHRPKRPITLRQAVTCGFQAG